MESHQPCQGHEGGARAPLGGVLPSTFPSGRSKARRSRPSGVRQQGHSGATGVKSHERWPPPTSNGSPSRRGWWAARLHRHTRAQPSRLSGAPLALASGALRRPTPQLRSHALRLAERGCHVPAPHEGHHGGTRGRVHRSPGRDGDGPRGAASASGASRGPWAWGLVRIGSRSPPSLLHQHPFILNIIR